MATPTKAMINSSTQVFLPIPLLLFGGLRCIIKSPLYFYKIVYPRIHVIVTKIGFLPSALSLSKGRSCFEADRSAVLRPKLTTNGI
jgi:hypothetical protein